MRNWISFYWLRGLGLGVFSMILLNSPAIAQITNLELARSHVEPILKLNIVIETRVVQKNSNRFVTIRVFEEDHYILKKLDAPILEMRNIPFAKAKEVRGTLAELMVVLAEYTFGGGKAVEFKVDFSLYGGRFNLTQKGLVHPMAEMKRLERIERAMNRLSVAEKNVQKAKPDQMADAQITLLRARRELLALKNKIGEPITDFEILYSHRNSMVFFQELIAALDRAGAVSKLLEESVIQEINRIKGINSPQPKLR